MRRAGIIAAALVALVAPLGEVAGKTSSVRKCARVEYQSGNGYYFYVSTRIRAVRVRCATARKVARVAPSNGARRYRRARFACTGRRTSRATVSFTCRRQRARVTFAWTTQ